jgi:Ca-activated chloride channel homolog
MKDRFMERNGLHKGYSHRVVVATFMVCLFAFQVAGQGGRVHVREGNKVYEKKDFPGAETNYRKALEADPGWLDAEFNLGNSLYKQEKYEDAAHTFERVAMDEKDKMKSAAAYHNLGNSLFKANKLNESIDAYKQALRRNPSDLDTKQNLAFVQSMLQQQQEKQQGDGDQDKDKDKEQDNKEEDKQEKEDSKRENEQQQPQEQQKDMLSKEDAQRMLDALEQDEKELQQKLLENKARSERVRTGRNW